MTSFSRMHRSPPIISSISFGGVKLEHSLLRSINLSSSSGRHVKSFIELVPISDSHGQFRNVFKAPLDRTVNLFGCRSRVIAVVLLVFGLEPILLFLLSRLHLC